MKFKLRNKNSIIYFIILIFALIFAFTSSFYMEKFLGNEQIIDNKVIRQSKKRHSNINKYIKNIKEDELIDEVNINNEVTEVLTEENDKLISKIFNYETGKEITIEDILLSDKDTLFWQKIDELIDLKYPVFISSVLKDRVGENVYYLKENELIIYFYNYDINPKPQEDLFLKVNYNEIAEYLNITVNLDEEYQNEDGSEIDLDKKLIAITFDDGPCSYTSHLVDVLKENKASATFFMLGHNLLNYRDTVLKVHQNNMEIGYHSYAHKSFKRQTLEEIQSEFEESNEILKSITGEDFKLVRPPYGALNSEIKESLNAPLILWHVDTEDWRYKDVDYLTNYVLDNTNNGDIVLFHDIHKTSIEAIEKLLPLLYVNGYQVVTVSELASVYDTSLEDHQTYRYFTK